MVRWSPKIQIQRVEIAWRLLLATKDSDQGNVHRWLEMFWPKRLLHRSVACWLKVYNGHYVFKPWWNFKFGAAVFLHNVSPVWPLEWHLVSALRVGVFNLGHRGQPYGCPSSSARSLEMAWSLTMLVMAQSTPPAIMVCNLWYPVNYCLYFSVTFWQFYWSYTAFYSFK